MEQIYEGAVVGDAAGCSGIRVRVGNGHTPGGGKLDPSNRTEGELQPRSHSPQWQWKKLSTLATLHLWGLLARRLGSSLLSLGPDQETRSTVSCLTNL